MPMSTVVEGANIALIEDENRVLREASSRERELIIECPVAKLPPDGTAPYALMVFAGMGRIKL